MGIFKKIFKAVSNLLGDIVGFLIGADFDDQQQAAGVLLNKSSNIAAIPVIYGERKVGGTRVFLSTGGGKKNEYLYMALVLCEGEVEQIGDVYINDTLSTDAKYSGLVSIQKFTGTDSQTYSTLLAGADDTWGADHRLRGVAYLAMRFKYDQDAPLTSIPDVQAIVKGRKVYDPRTSTTGWSSNPALCLRDYLTNDRYGKGLSTSVIDDASIIAAANTCDTLVAQYSGASTTSKLLECNAVLDTGKKLFDNVKILLQGMRGLMPFQDGRYSLLIDTTNNAARFRLDDSNITSDITVKGSGKNRRYNRVRAKFVNPESNWQEDSVDWPPEGATRTAFLNNDNGEELVKDVTLNTITSYYAARDIARIICLASRQHELTVEVTATAEALQIAVGDVVELEHDSMGWTGAAIKEFRVLAMSLKEEGEVDLTLQEYSNIYGYDAGAQAPSSQETTLDDPFSVAAPTNLVLTTGVNVGADGGAIPYLDITWTAVDDSLVTEYIINVTPSGFDPFEVILTTPDTDGNDATSYLISPALVTTYSVSVRAQNINGIRSEPITDTIVVTGDTVAPSAPSGLTATGGPKSIHLTWTNPSDTDFSWVQIQRRLYNTGTYLTIGSVFGNPSSKSVFVDAGLADNVRYQYRIRAYDWSQNASAFAAAADATTDAPSVVSSDLQPRTVHGYVYYQTAQASQPSTPSASDYDFEAAVGDNPFTGLTAGWGINPPTPSTNTSNTGDPFWVARFYVTETVYNGTVTATFSSPFQSTVFDGLVTFRNLNTELADAASSLLTQIDGGLIKTGVIDLANDTNMAIRQGKSAYTDNANGFWLGNFGTQASPDPRFYLGDSDQYLKWNGTTLQASGIEILAQDGTTLLESGGRFQTINDTVGQNLIFNGDFSKGSAGWVDWPSGYESVVFDEFTGTATATSTATQPARAVMDSFVKVTEGETLYLYSIAEGAKGSMAVEWYSDDGAGNKTSEGFAAFDGTDTNQGTDDDQAWSSAKQLRHVKVTVPASTTTGNTTRYARVVIETVDTTSATTTFYEVGLTRTPVVINPSYAGTYIRDLSVDTLQIQNNAVTVPETLQIGSASTYMTNGTRIVVGGLSLAVDFGTNVPDKVLILGQIVMETSGTGSDWAAANAEMRYVTSAGSVGPTAGINQQTVQVNSRKGAPPTLTIAYSVDGWSGVRYMFMTLAVTGESASATGWWKVDAANISVIGARR